MRFVIRLQVKQVIKLIQFSINVQGMSWKGIRNNIRERSEKINAKKYEGAAKSNLQTKKSLKI